jgi:D-alanine-D-alanine ligase
MSTKPRVLVVFGGDSSEHEISCLTARGVLAAIDTDRYDTVCVGIARGGQWVLVDKPTVRAYHIDKVTRPAVDPTLPGALLCRQGDAVIVARRDGDRLVDVLPVDVALVLLHGPFGEDGTIQGLFEMMGLPYAGAGVLASAACQDKVTMNLILAAAGLPVGPSVGIDPVAWHWQKEACLERIATLTYPLFVKPARGGSSIGISRVETPAELIPAIDLAQRYDPKVIVEQGIEDMREIECGLLIDRRESGPAVSLLGEIRVNTATRFYDFGSKYLPDAQVDLVVPAELGPAVTAEIQRLAAAACLALDVEGLARVDMFVTDKEIVINEVNTMPGFTPGSLFPRVWEASGVPYSQLIGRLVDEALARPRGLR